MAASQTNQLQLDRQLKRGENSANLFNKLRVDSFEDLYKDFDSVYESMCQTATNSQNTPNESIYGGSSSTSGGRQQHDNRSDNAIGNWSKGAIFETETLAKSLVEVEEALKKATTTSENNNNSNSPTSSILVAEVEPQLTQIPSSQVSPIYGKPVSTLMNNKNQQAQQQQQSTQLIHLPQPSLSPMLSTATSEQTRADSRNTNQSYQNGPALVEEMTLSDLEDEISLSLMDTKENQSRQYFSDGEQLMLRTRRSRNPLPTSLSRHINNNHVEAQVNNRSSVLATRVASRGTLINHQTQQQQQPLLGYHSTSRRYPRTAQGMYSRARQMQ